MNCSNILCKNESYGKCNLEKNRLDVRGICLDIALLNKEERLNKLQMMEDTPYDYKEDNSMS